MVLSINNTTTHTCKCYITVQVSVCGERGEGGGIHFVVLRKIVSVTSPLAPRIADIISSMVSE